MKSLSQNYIIIEPNSGLMCNNLYSAAFQALLGIRFNKSLSFAKYSRDEMGYGGDNLDGTFPHFFDFNKLDIVDSPKEYPEPTNGEIHTLIRSSNLADILELEAHDSHGLDFRISPNEFFQEPIAAKYIRSNLDKIFHKELLEGNEAGIFIHYRLGDISNLAAINVEHFESAIISIPNYENLPKYISSDDPNNSRIKKICNDYGFTLYESSPQETIKFGSRFTNKLLSYGTFSWFIGVLGSQNNIIFPNSNDYIRWHGDIFVFNDWHEFDRTKRKISLSWKTR